ncbi:hypothetical protein [Delftia acidovorans]|uniref:hypothetical protein n=1 Tax=Delftia acidovorans TaxID=80866 RepID=UPI001C0CE72B|nr:hypothetical protein [Delftia acidovorans]
MGSASPGLSCFWRCNGPDAKKSAACELRISVNGTDQVKADLALLAEAAKSLLDIFNALIDVFGGRVEACSINFDCDPAFLTGELRIQAKLTDRLADLVTTLRVAKVNVL